MRRSITVLLATGVAVAAGSAPAAATEYVDDDGVQCPSAAHTTIQAGVNAASVNEQVIVCNGIYREQVTIAGAAKNGVDLVSNTTLGATIKAPTTPLTAPEALVYIDGASNVKVRRFRIAGPGPGTVDSLRHGVLVENNAAAPIVEAQVLDNRITDIRDSEAAANEEGIGVRVGRDYAGTAGRASVLRNTIVDYQKGGIVVDGPGSFALVSLNTIEGLGFMTSPITPVPAQQGIQVARQAGADVNSNTITQNLYSGVGFESFGILMFNTTTAADPRAPSRPSRLKNNIVTTNDVGIYMQDVRNQRLETNRVYDNGDAATTASDGGIILAETAPSLGGGNTLYRNDARTNVGDDCADFTTGTGTAGTGNTWTLNKGLDAFPPAICTP